MSLFSALLTRRQTLPLLPLTLADGPIYAVGDLHGCRSLYHGLQLRIQADAAQLSGRPRILLLGDMVDRGPDTAGLINDLTLPLSWGERLALRGNHEQMMLDFLDDPFKNPAWLEYGGYETLRSYGLALDPAAPLSMPRKRLLQMLVAHIAGDHLVWLRALPGGYVLSGGDQPWVFAHAGFDPRKDLASQPADVLMWGGALPQPRDHIRLVHGHVIQQNLSTAGPCIGLDLGSYKTGKLAALRLAVGLQPKLLIHTAVPA